MRQKVKIPRIVKIEKISEHKIQCMFNNGESRVLDFAKIFKQWNVAENVLEYPLMDEKVFKKVKNMLHIFFTELAYSLSHIIAPNLRCNCTWAICYSFVIAEPNGCD